MSTGSEPRSFDGGPTMGWSWGGVKVSGRTPLRSMKGTSLRLNLRLITSLAALAVGTGMAVLPSSPASAATVLCTTNAYANPLRIVLPSLSNGSTSCSLFSGDTNNGVYALQESINLCYPTVIGKYYPLSQDGQFGSNTKAALKLVQSKIGASADGNYGPETKTKVLWAGFEDEPDFTPPCHKWTSDK
jgi:peptidoglycan hydrolase-like protein with peptidoglycan-binding domain